ncbi:MAG: sodium-dependent transporter [Gemmatimonadota bacterium]
MPRSTRSPRSSGRETRAAQRETFTSRFATLAAMVGVAIGLGNVWRLPYMIGQFGGAAFVALYLAAVLAIGVPALVAEWTLGRHTRRGPVGAFERAGLPFGRALGALFFLGVTAATGYYTAVIGWTLHHAVAQLAALAGAPLDAAAVLPPETGFDPAAWALGTGWTALVVLAATAVLARGVREGIEAASRFITPALFAMLLLMIVRASTLPGGGEGVRWLFLTFDPSAISAGVALAAIGQAAFSLALGGTFMVVYGSYLDADEGLVGNAALTAAGDTAAGLLAGLAIFPAVFALGLEPAAGPALLYQTLPEVFSAVPGGPWFGLIFFGGLSGAAFLSAVAALEVLVAGLVDHTGIARRRAVALTAALVFLASLPPTLNLRVFVPWDLAFGSGFQTVGALCAVCVVGWALDRTSVLREIAGEYGSPRTRLLYLWLRYVVPLALAAVGGWWLATEVLGLTG